MRLLKTVGLTFDDKAFSRNVKYAILSHRWEDGEVSYDDMPSPAAHTMKGYAKIREFCAIARLKGYEYAWVDTCCINKKDFTEFNEAINSMFSWYRKSDLCMVYLSDFLNQREMNRESPKSQLSRSKWFTRGWTLQELIAPARVEFFDAQWRYFGNKRNLASIISYITGISEALLNGQRELRSYSCAQKMSWAAQRETSKPEDRAYSLLGLFDITLPMIYDGDGAHAFRRLQEEIIKNSTDQSIFAWVQYGPSPFWYRGHSIIDKQCSILAPSPDCFQFSSHIVPYDRKDTDPYYINNVGLSITRDVRKVISLGDMVLLEVSLSCYDKISHQRVSITVVGSKAFYKSAIEEPPPQYVPSSEYPTYIQAPKANTYGSLPVTRVQPHYLGPTVLWDGCVSTNSFSHPLPLQISTVFVESGQRSLSADTTWMSNPEWERRTLQAMKSARKEIRELYLQRQKNRDKRIVDFLKLVAMGLGGFAVLGLLKDPFGCVRNDTDKDEDRRPVRIREHSVTT